MPSDYDELNAYYTRRGYRVIACAAKHIPKLNWVKVQKMKRDEAECEMNFTGLIIFENPLKSSTAGVLNELTEAGIRKVMCTGDNILTAISVARECNLIDKTAHCFVPYLVEGQFQIDRLLSLWLTKYGGDFQDPNARLSWQSVDNNIYTLDEQTLMVGLSNRFHCWLLTCIALTSSCRRRRISTLRYIEPSKLLFSSGG